MSCIPNNEEKYKTISKNVLVDVVRKVQKNKKGVEKEVKIFYKLEFKDTLKVS